MLEDRVERFLEMMSEHISATFFIWLEAEGFFEAPASRNYHGNSEGQLFEHSYNVAKELERLTIANNLKWLNPRSPYIIGMFHDLCKINRYKYYWEIENDECAIFKIELADNMILNGHGDKSIMLLSQFMTLTMEEILCIRWHMGAFDTEENKNYYSASVSQYPNVLWTHVADMISAKITENK